MDDNTNSNKAITEENNQEKLSQMKENLEEISKSSGQVSQPPEASVGGITTPPLPSQPTPIKEQVVSTVTGEKEVGRSKLVLWIATIFFALSLLGLVAYFVGAFKEGRISLGKKVTVTPTPASTLEPTPEVTTTPASNAEWETYESDYYKLQYPGDFITREEEATFSLSKLGPTQKEGTEMFDGISLSFVVKEALGKTLNTYVNEKMAEIKSLGVSEVTNGPDPVVFNGYTGQSYTEEGLGTFEVMVIISSDKKVFLEISRFVADPGNLGFEQIADEILETIEFSTSTQTTAPTSGFGI